MRRISAHFLQFFSAKSSHPLKKLCKKCAEMRWFFKIFSAKTLHHNALKCDEMRWNFVRNALNFHRNFYKVYAHFSTIQRIIL